MERTCERAVDLGLPAVAFTEHVDLTAWVVRPGEVDAYPQIAKHVVDGAVVAPKMDVEGYLECLERCRDRFPDLRIISGVELGQPHWHREEVAQLLAAGPFDRVLGSLHCLPLRSGYAEPPNLFRERPPADVMRDFLAEVPRLLAECDVFSVLAHIDYPVRYWPGDAEPFDPKALEDEFREALRAIAESGRVLEVNTRIGFPPEVVRWFREEGGEAVTFGSDAHVPNALARGFADAVAMVEAFGFRRGAHPYDIWVA